MNVVVQGDRVRFEVEGWDKLWAFKSQLEADVVEMLRSTIATERPDGV